METSPLEEHAVGSLVLGLLDLDPDAVHRVITERAQDGVSSLVAELIVPAWIDVRGRHRDGEIDRVTLVAATALLRRALMLVANESPRPRLYPLNDTESVTSDRSRPDRPRVVVASPAGVDHLLGAEALAEVLGSLGWPVDLIVDGGDGLARHLTTRAAMALVVSCTEETGLPAVGRAVDAAHAVGVPVVVTGPALGTDGLRALRLGADVWIPAVGGVAMVLDGWRDHRVHVAGPQGLPAEFAAFEVAEATIVATALGVAGASSGPDGHVRDRVREVVSHLGAAVLVDDSRILLDHLTMQRGQEEDGETGDLAIIRLVDAVAASVPADLERSRRFVSEAREHLRRTLLRGARGLRPLTDAPPVAAPNAVACRPASDEPVVPGISGGLASPGQAFADLLLLGALACQAPVALLSVPQPDGQWSTLSYGCDQRQGLNDPTLFDVLTKRSEAVEFPDLSANPEVSRSPLLGAPHHLRWAYGVTLRAPDGVVLGVFCVLDRWLRQLTRREQRATLAVGRQMAMQLAALRKTPPRPVAPPAPLSELPVSLPSISSGPSVPAAPSLVGLRRAAGISEGQQLLRSHEVAVLFDVTERTVINWAAAGKLPSLRTIGGHLRFRSEDVHKLLAGRGVAVHGSSAS
jgi:excisionase family DNA binding protein